MHKSSQFSFKTPTVTSLVLVASLILSACGGGGGGGGGSSTASSRPVTQSRPSTPTTIPKTSQNTNQQTAQPTPAAPSSNSGATKPLAPAVNPTTSNNLDTTTSPLATQVGLSASERAELSRSLSSGLATLSTYQAINGEALIAVPGGVTTPATSSYADNQARMQQLQALQAYAASGNLNALPGALRAQVVGKSLAQVQELATSLVTNEQQARQTFWEAEFDKLDSAYAPVTGNFTDANKNFQTDLATNLLDARLRSQAGTPALTPEYLNTGNTLSDPKATLTSRYQAYVKQLALRQAYWEAQFASYSAPAVPASAQDQAEQALTKQRLDLIANRLTPFAERYAAYEQEQRARDRYAEQFAREHSVESLNSKYAAPTTVEFSQLISSVQSIDPVTARLLQQKQAELLGAYEQGTQNNPNTQDYPGSTQQDRLSQVSNPKLSYQQRSQAYQAELQARKAFWQQALSTSDYAALPDNAQPEALSAAQTRAATLSSDQPLSAKLAAYQQELQARKTYWESTLGSYSHAAVPESSLEASRQALAGSKPAPTQAQVLYSQAELDAYQARQAQLHNLNLSFSERQAAKQAEEAFRADYQTRLAQAQEQAEFFRTWKQQLEQTPAVDNLSKVDDEDAKSAYSDRLAYFGELEASDTAQQNSPADSAKGPVLGEGEYSYQKLKAAVEAELAFRKAYWEQQAARAAAAQAEKERTEQEARERAEREEAEFKAQLNQFEQEAVPDAKLSEQERREVAERLAKLNNANLDAGERELAKAEEEAFRRDWYAKQAQRLAAEKAAAAEAEGKRQAEQAEAERLAKLLTFTNPEVPEDELTEQEKREQQERLAQIKDPSNDETIREQYKANEEEFRRAWHERKAAEQAAEKRRQEQELAKRQAEADLVAELNNFTNAQVPEDRLTPEEREARDQRLAAINNSDLTSEERRQYKQNEEDFRKQWHAAEQARIEREKAEAAETERKAQAERELVARLTSFTNTEVPDERLTAEQRRDRDERLAKLRDATLSAEERQLYKDNEENFRKQWHAEEQARLEAERLRQEREAAEAKRKAEFEERIASFTHGEVPEETLSPAERQLVAERKAALADPSLDDDTRLAYHQAEEDFRKAYADKVAAAEAKKHQDQEQLEVVNTLIAQSVLVPNTPDFAQVEKQLEGFEVPTSAYNAKTQEDLAFYQAQAQNSKLSDEERAGYAELAQSTQAYARRAYLKQEYQKQKALAEQARTEFAHYSEPDPSNPASGLDLVAQKARSLDVTKDAEVELEAAKQINEGLSQLVDAPTWDALASQERIKRATNPQLSQEQRRQAHQQELEARQAYWQQASLYQAAQNYDKANIRQAEIEELLEAVVIGNQDGQISADEFFNLVADTAADKLKKFPSTDPTLVGTAVDFSEWSAADAATYQSYLELIHELEAKPHKDASDTAALTDLRAQLALVQAQATRNYWNKLLTKAQASRQAKIEAACAADPVACALDVIKANAATKDPADETSTNPDSQPGDGSTSDQASSGLSDADVDNFIAEETFDARADTLARADAGDNTGDNARDNTRDNAIELSPEELALWGEIYSTDQLDKYTGQLSTVKATYKQVAQKKAAEQESAAEDAETSPELIKQQKIANQAYDQQAQYVAEIRSQLATYRQELAAKQAERERLAQQKRQARQREDDERFIALVQRRAQLQQQAKDNAVVRDLVREERLAASRQYPTVEQPNAGEATPLNQASRSIYTPTQPASASSATSGTAPTSYSLSSYTKPATTYQSYANGQLLEVDYRDKLRTDYGSSEGELDPYDLERNQDGIKLFRLEQEVSVRSGQILGAPTSGSVHAGNYPVAGTEFTSVVDSASGYSASQTRDDSLIVTQPQYTAKPVADILAAVSAQAGAEPVNFARKVTLTTLVAPHDTGASPGQSATRLPLETQFLRNYRQATPTGSSGLTRTQLEQQLHYLNANFSLAGQQLALAGTLNDTLGRTLLSQKVTLAQPTLGRGAPLSLQDLTRSSTSISADAQRLKSLSGQTPAKGFGSLLGSGVIVGVSDNVFVDFYRLQGSTPQETITQSLNADATYSRGFGNRVTWLTNRPVFRSENATTAERNHGAQVLHALANQREFGGVAPLSNYYLLQNSNTNDSGLSTTKPIYNGRLNFAATVNAFTLQKYLPHVINLSWTSTPLYGDTSNLLQTRASLLGLSELYSLIKQAEHTATVEKLPENALSLRQSLATTRANDNPVLSFLDAFARLQRLGDRVPLLVWAAGNQAFDENSPYVANKLTGYNWGKYADRLFTGQDYRTMAQSVYGDFQLFVTGVTGLSTQSISDDNLQSHQRNFNAWYQESLTQAKNRLLASNRSAFDAAARETSDASSKLLPTDPTAETKDATTTNAQPSPLSTNLNSGATPSTAQDAYLAPNVFTTYNVGGNSGFVKTLTLNPIQDLSQLNYQLAPGALACGELAYSCLAQSFSFSNLLRYPTSPITSTSGVTIAGVDRIGLQAGNVHISYEPSDGTSFAAPAVTGIAALVKQNFPWMTANQLKQTLLSTAIDIGKPGVDELFGWGVANADAAVRGPATFISNWKVDLSRKLYQKSYLEDLTEQERTEGQTGINNFKTWLSAEGESNKDSNQLPPSRDAADNRTSTLDDLANAEDVNNKAYFFVNNINGVGGLSLKGNRTQYLYLTGHNTYTGDTRVQGTNLVYVAPKVFFKDQQAWVQDVFLPQLLFSQAIPLEGTIYKQRAANLTIQQESSERLGSGYTSTAALKQLLTNLAPELALIPTRTTSTTRPSLETTRPTASRTPSVASTAGVNPTPASGFIGNGLNDLDKVATNGSLASGAAYATAWANGTNPFPYALTREALLRNQQYYATSATRSDFYIDPDSSLTTGDAVLKSVTANGDLALSHTLIVNKLDLYSRANLTLEITPADAKTAAKLDLSNPNTANSPVGLRKLAQLAAVAYACSPSASGHGGFDGSYAAGTQVGAQAGSNSGATADSTAAPASSHCEVQVINPHQYEPEYHRDSDGYAQNTTAGLAGWQHYGNTNLQRYSLDADDRQLLLTKVIGSLADVISKLPADKSLSDVLAGKANDADLTAQAQAAYTAGVRAFEEAIKSKRDAWALNRGIEPDVIADEVKREIDSNSYPDVLGYLYSYGLGQDFNLSNQDWDAKVTNANSYAGKLAYVKELLETPAALHVAGTLNAGGVLYLKASDASLLNGTYNIIKYGKRDNLSLTESVTGLNWSRISDTASSSDEGTVFYAEGTQAGKTVAVESVTSQETTTYRSDFLEVRTTSNYLRPEWIYNNKLRTLEVTFKPNSAANVVASASDLSVGDNTTARQGANLVEAILLQAAADAQANAVAASQPSQATTANTEANTTVTSTEAPAASAPVAETSNASTQLAASTPADAPADARASTAVVAQPIQLATDATNLDASNNLNVPAFAGPTATTPDPNANVASTSADLALVDYDHPGTSQPEQNLATYVAQPVADKVDGPGTTQASTTAASDKVQAQAQAASPSASAQASDLELAADPSLTSNQLAANAILKSPNSADLLYRASASAFSSAQVALGQANLSLLREFSRSSLANFSYSRDLSLSAYAYYGRQQNNWVHSDSRVKGEFSHNDLVGGLLASWRSFNFGLAVGRISGSWEEKLAAAKTTPASSPTPANPALASLASAELTNTGILLSVGKSTKDWALGFTGGFSVENYQLKRSVLADNDLTANFTRYLVSANLEASYALVGNRSRGLQLVGRLSTLLAHRPEFNEAASAATAAAPAQAFAIAGKSDTQVNAWAQVGLVASYDFGQVGMSRLLDVSLSWQRQLTSNYYQVNFSKQGQNLATATHFKPTDLVSFKAGYQHDFTKQLSVRLGLDYSYSSDWTTKQANLQVTYRF